MNIQQHDSPEQKLIEALQAIDKSTDSVYAGKLAYEAIPVARSLIAELAELREKATDTKRLDWLEVQLETSRFEIAKSLYRGGYEFGFWPKTGPVAEVHSGTLREAIDKLIEQKERTK